MQTDTEEMLGKNAPKGRHAITFQLFQHLWPTFSILVLILLMRCLAAPAHVHAHMDFGCKKLSEQSTECGRKLRKSSRTEYSIGIYSKRTNSYEYMHFLSLWPLKLMGATHIGHSRVKIHIRMLTYCCLVTCHTSCWSFNVWPYGGRQKKGKNTLFRFQKVNSWVNRTRQWL